MKVKVKRKNEKVIIEANNLEELHQKVTEAFGLPEVAILSLNGNDPIDVCGSFSSVGIVQGDIIRIVDTNESALPEPQSANFQSVDKKQPDKNTDDSNSRGNSNTLTPSGALAQVQNLDSVLKELELTKTHDTVYTYKPVIGSTIITTSNQIDSSELINVVAKYHENVMVENIFITQSTQRVNLMKPVLKKQINQIRKWAGMRPVNGLLSLPDEILFKIVSHLDADNLLAIGAVCRPLYALSRIDTFWKRQYFQDFTTLSDNDCPWRDLYLEARRERKRRSREVRPSFSDPNIPFMPLPSPLSNLPGTFPTTPYIPGMIGGEYDLRPGMPFPHNPLSGPTGFRPRGDPSYTPGSITDPDANRRMAPEFPHGNDHHGMFNPDGSINFTNPGRRVHGRSNRFNPFGGGFL